jgi:hypothetical protein
MQRTAMFSTPSARVRCAGFALGTGVAGIGGTDNVLAGAVAVVEDRLRLAVAVGVEQRADVGEAVPLGRILQVHDGEVVVHHVGEVGIVSGEGVIEVGLVAAHGRAQQRRMAARVEHVAARVVERQAEAEAQSLAHLGDALSHFGGRDQVHAAELIVGAEVAPVRPVRPALPTSSHQ